MRIRSGAAAFSVTTALAAVATAGFSLAVVALGWAVGTLVMLVLPLCRRRREGLQAVTLMFGTGAMTAAVLGAERAFPADSTFPFVSGMLLLLLWRALCGRREGPGRVAAVLGLLLLPVFAAALLLGMREVSWREAVSGSGNWEQFVTAVAAASPWWALEEEKRDKQSWRWYGAAVGTSLGLSLLTHGTLGAALAEAEQFPLFRAVQTVHIVNAQHAEALVAAAVLLGSFSMLLTLGEMTVSAVRSKPKEDVRWKIAGVLVAVFLLEWVIRNAVGAISQPVRTVFWGLVPVGTLWLVFSTKTSKKA